MISIEPYNDEENDQQYREGRDENESFLPSKLHDPSKRSHNIPFSPTAYHSDNVGLSLTVRCGNFKKSAL